MTDKRKEHYKKCTDDIYTLFECFKESGFTDEQAIDLTSAYVRQSLFDNVMRAERDEMRRRAEVRDIKARTDKLRHDMATSPGIATMTCRTCGKNSKDYPELKFHIAPYDERRAGGYICEDCYLKENQNEQK